MPHSHLLGNTWEIFTVSEDSKETDVLLKINDWDFKWKHQFDFSKPIILKKGTTVHALAKYDNTKKNLSNPSSPPRKMTWGRRMFEEMFLVYFKIVPIKSENAIELLFFPSMVSKEELSFRFFNQKNQNLSFIIKNFEGEKKLEIFQNKNFKKGKHQIKSSLKNLANGNYFLEIINPQNGKVNQYAFVKVDPLFFD